MITNAQIACGLFCLGTAYSYVQASNGRSDLL